MPTRSEQRRINIQQGKPMNEGLEDCKTCKDCIHYDVCAKYNKVYERELSHRYCTECKDFKDKSRYIELPCAVGDVVYMHFEGEVIPLLITRVSVEIKAEESSLYYDAKNESVATCFTPRHINKTIFLTKEEAEQALKGGVQG